MSATSTSSLADLPGRRRSGARGPWQRALALAVAGVTAAVTLAGVAGSPLFGLETVRVVGASRLSRDEVVRLSGLLPGDNVLLLSAGAVEARLESNPWIADASVRRSLPATVILRIRERRPVAVAEADAGLLLVAADGTPLEVVAGDPGLPRIVAGADLASRGGPRAALGPPAAVLAAMPAGLRAEVRRVVVGPEGDLELRMRTGTRVVFGPASGARAKVAALAGVLRWGRGQAVRFGVIDVSAPRSPVARLV